MKTFFRLALQALILLVVALLSAVTAMRFAIHGREVAVPDLVGKTPPEARRIAELNGFQFEVERQYYSLKVPEGRILSQLPLPSARVRRGWQIRVAESLGPQRVVIPDVVGESERAAEINILRRGLNLGSVANVELPDVPANQVIAQSPSASASSISAPKISLLAAQAESPQAFLMPSFVGRTVKDATAALKNAGIQPGNITPVPSQSEPPESALLVAPPAPPSPASVIVSQNPAAGAKVLSGSSVSFEVR
ncbi:MAG TPA: PASTA domain-containing protein [Terriglobales bacterium]|jgi:eukaryotic-like serine/threonine-protein kinase|nr:PASTA domain-containing protein [Terriglobales bacterium]